jgi:hypothetical protein
METLKILTILHTDVNCFYFCCTISMILIINQFLYILVVNFSEIDGFTNTVFFFYNSVRSAVLHINFNYTFIK